MEQVVAKSPNRRRMRNKQNGGVARRKPVVDVPVVQSDSNAIGRFKQDHGQWLTDFLEKEWAEEATNEVVTAVIEEVAQCTVLNRTARSGEFWDSDTIEYILDTFHKANPPEAPKKPGPPKKLTKRQKEVKARPVTMGNTESRRSTRKGQARTAKGRGKKIPVSLADINKARGNQRWELAIIKLKEEGRFWCQSQDTKKIAKTLRAVSVGLHDLPDTLQGEGSRSYGRDKLARGLAMIREIAPVLLEEGNG